uniref:Nicotinic acetylcholine receptor beta 6 subunit n=1 Tax=Blattella germanica TaxID=6973 RepID=A0A7T5Y195_BLAGE|nr:nicotinic acetylcholine receptor beta 6 subunit [Blattella germanica]
MNQLLLILLSLYSYKVIFADNCEVTPTAKTASLRLKENLLECGYDKTVRPVIYHGNQTTVTISMKLRKLTHDPYICSVIIHCWMIWEWKDEHLHWNPSDYEGVNTLNIASDEIWVPEIAQLSLSSYWEVERRIPYGTCEVGSTGIVRCTSDSVYYSICNAELTYWPYDSLNCSLLLGAWMQEGEEITIQITDNNVDLHEYEADHHWILDSATVTRHLEKYEVNSTIPWIQYSFFIRRHASLYEATVVLPGILFSILVLTTFWILPEGSNRINLCCVAVICHYLQLQYVGWTLGGEGEKCPLVVLFYRDSLLLNCLAIFFAIVSRTLVSTTAAVPAWVSKYTGWILSWRFGQILLLTEMSPEIAATADEDGKEEGTGLVAATKTKPSSNWKIFVKLIDRISFVFCLLLYIFMLSSLTLETKIYSMYGLKNK